MGASEILDKVVLHDETGKPVSAWYNEDVSPQYDVEQGIVD
jgi:hypothetical protein